MTIGELGDDGNVIPGTKKVVDVEEVRKAIENGDHTETGWPRCAQSTASSSSRTSPSLASASRSASSTSG